MKKIIGYMNKELFDDPSDSTNYLLEGLAEYPSDFKVFRTGNPDPSLATDYDVIFCRFEIPINTDFLTALTPLEGNGKLFINPPSAKMNEHSKRNLRQFIGTDILPPTCISSDPDELSSFAETLEGRLIVKPIDLNGGRGIERLDPDDKDAVYAHAMNLTRDGTTEAVFQQFIEGVEELGDKRINIFLYEPVACATRIPKDGFICNLSAGGSTIASELTPRDMHIVETIAPYLKEQGITWAGIDVLGDYLGEINVSSPGGLYKSDKVKNTTRGRDRVIELLRDYQNGD